MDRTANFYSQPTYGQRGSGLPVYSGARRQRGGSVLGALKNFIMPLLGQVKQKAIKHAKREALNLAKGVAMDAVRGQNIGNSLKKRGIHHLKQLGKNMATDTVQGFAGSSTPPRKRKPPTEQCAPLRKRRKVVNNF